MLAARGFLGAGQDPVIGLIPGSVLPAAHLQGLSTSRMLVAMPTAGSIPCPLLPAPMGTNTAPRP